VEDSRTPISRDTLEWREQRDARDRDLRGSRDYLSTSLLDPNPELLRQRAEIETRAEFEDRVKEVKGDYEQRLTTMREDI